MKPHDVAADFSECSARGIMLLLGDFSYTALLAIGLILLTLASSILGCIYPALKSARTRYIEQPF